MATITHRVGNSRNLTAAEVDANFDGLNADIVAANAAIAVKADASATSSALAAKADAAATASALAGKAAAASAIAFSTAIPLDGNKYMSGQPRVLTSATAFSVSGTPVAGAQCVVKVASNGSIVPSFTGMVEWGGSSGWVGALGTINTITFFSDGWTSYYSIAQNNSAPVTLPVPTAAAKTGTVAPGQLDITLSAPISTGTVPEASKFSITTTNGGAQADTVNSVSLPNSTTVRLVTSRAATAGDSTTVSYDPSQGSLAQRLVDASGNPLFWFTNLAVTVQSFIGPLDAYTTNLAMAFSLRRLLTSWTGVGADKRLAQVLNSNGSTYNILYDSNGNPDYSLLPGTGTNSLTRIYNQTGSGLDMVPVATAGALGFSLQQGGGANGKWRLQDNSGQPMKIDLASGPLVAGLCGAAGDLSIFMVNKLGSGLVFNGVFGSVPAAGPQFLVDCRTDASNRQLRWFNTPNNTFSPGMNFTASDVLNWHALSAHKYGASAVGSHAAKALALRARNTAMGVVTTADVAGGADPTTLGNNTQWQWGSAQNSNAAQNSEFAELIGFNTGVSDTVRDAVESSQTSYFAL